MADNRVPTPKASAVLLAWGTVLCVITPALLGASWYAHTVEIPDGDPNGVPNSVLLAAIGWVLLLLGAILLAVGVQRLAANADRAAVVRAAANRTPVTTPPD
jgi:hypothetical protein